MIMPDPVSAALGTMASSINMSQSSPKKSSNWFEAFADAWGKALDTQADNITQQADTVTAGGDKPSDITKLTAESLKLSFIANSSHTSIDSVAKALETMARKS
jgi:hypothetical protein